MKRLIAFGLAFVAAIVAVYAIRNDGRSGNEVVRLTRIDSVPESKPIGDNKTVFKASLSKATKVKRIASLEPSDESIRARLENPDSEKETYEATLPTIAIPVTPFDASEVDAIVVTMQPETGKQQPRLYWLREGETEPTKDAGTQFRFSFDGKSHTESIAVSQCPGWRGRIVALRLVPTDTATDVTVTAIDGIHFAPPSTGRAQVSVGAEVRDSIVTSSDSSTEVRVTAVAGSRLDFAVGVPDEAWNRDGGPVTFTVRVNGEERARRVVDPRANADDRRWFEESISPLPTGSLSIQLGVAFSKEETCPRAAFGSPIVSAPVAGPARHVVLVSLDTLRADHVGCYGYDKPTSP
ncbi:MAG: hypothetical protein HY292_19120, partial [Planctomycetes bacterium]|nr:hypothetical protein [Planctomycetota bacterium]